MSYISLSEFGRASLPMHKSKKEPFRNSRIVHKLRGGLAQQNLEESERVLRTEPNEPSFQPKLLLDRVRPHFEDDARSERSHRSVASQKSVKSSFATTNNRALKLMSMSESANASQRSFNLGEKEEQLLQHLSLVELEKRLDTLLDAKMRALLESNQRRLTAKHVSDFERVKLSSKMRRLDASLSKILEALQRRKEIHSGGELGWFEQWRQLEGKIQLLEKILAENMTELEIMKHYFAMCSQRSTSYKAMCSPVERLGGRSTQNSMHRTPGLHDSLGHSKPILAKFPLTTVNKSSYAAPEENAYQKFRWKHPSYEKTPRPLPNSNYKVSYQKYPPMRQYSDYTASDNINKLGPSPFVDGSSYRKEYTGRRAHVEDYKQLDCFRDKFRDLKIRYFNKHRLSNPEERESFISLEKLANRPNKIERLQTEPCLPLQSTNRLAHKRISLIEQRIFKQHPKDQRLQRLAHNFRMHVGA